MATTKMGGTAKQLAGSLNGFDASKQHQAGAERALADSDRYNAVLKLLIVDDQLRQIVDAYVAMGHAERAELLRHAVGKR